MLMQAHLGEYKVNTSQIHGKVVKFPENIDYLFFSSKYQHLGVQKQVAYLLCTIYPPSVTCKVPGCVYTACG